VISNENIGHPIHYWMNGQRIGTLLEIEGNTAVIKNVIPKKRNIKVPVSVCEPYRGESKMTIFEELYKEVEKHAGFKRQSAEQSDEVYIQSLLVVVQKIPELDWNKVTKPSRDWYNAAAMQWKKDKSILPCPGFLGKDSIKKAELTVTPPQGMTATEALKIKIPESGRMSSTEPNIANTPKSNIPKKQITGVMDALRKTVIIHPEWSSRQVYDYLRLNGYPNAKLDTISVDGGNIRRVIDIMKELGWKEPE
jgi:hypothetical protein